jgi:predicted TIM-barrel fold metal-dependent hydrolase
MKKTVMALSLYFLFSIFFPCQVTAQTVADPALTAEIYKIKVIDHHAHPLVAVNENEKDTGWDELCLGSTGETEIEMALIPYRLSPASPELINIWRALWGYTYNTINKEQAIELTEVKKRVMREQGDNYPAWVLDKIGVDTMFANRRTMGRGLTAPRFQLVTYADMLMFPLDNERARKENPDHNRYYPSIEMVLKQSLKDVRVARLPLTLDKYLTKVVTPVLEKHKRDGAIAVKFLTAYLRPLDITNPPAEKVRKVYARYVNGGKPPADEYKALQDYLFRYIAREAGRIGLVIHIHTGFGIGRYFDVEGSNPLLLEQVFNDPTLRDTTFVIIHGGWPFAKQTAAMLLKPNVYADFSAIAFLIYPRELSEVIRSWLEIQPQKVMFGTDAFDVGHMLLNWEEFTWLGTDSSRRALALALTGMMNDGEITNQQAVEIARKVLRENAIKLYKLNGS